MNAYLIYIFVLLLSSSRLSILRMQELGISLLGKLKLEPVTVEMTAMITRLETTLNLYLVEVLKWQGDKSKTKGKVSAFTEILLSVPLLIDSWMSIVKVLMPGDKNVLLVLFGNKVSIFYHGRQGAILNAFTNLYNLLADYPDLADLRTEVAAFIVTLKAAYNTKATSKSSVKIESDQIIYLHDLLGSIILGTFGQLINFFRTSPFDIERFFDSNITRYNKNNPEKIRRNQSWVDVVFGITFNASMVQIRKNGYFYFQNFTDAPINVYTASNANAPVPEGALIIPPFGKVGSKVNDLGSALNTFLLFKIKEGTKAGRVKVTSLNHK